MRVDSSSRGAAGNSTAAAIMREAEAISCGCCVLHRCWVDGARKTQRHCSLLEVVVGDSIQRGIAHLFIIAPRFAREIWRWSPISRPKVEPRSMRLPRRRDSL